MKLNNFEKTRQKGITAVNKEKVVGACCCEYFNIIFLLFCSIERVASKKRDTV